MVKTLKEAEDRIRAAMKPQQGVGGNGFSPNIQNIRQAAKRRPLPARRQLTTAS